MTDILPLLFTLQPALPTTTAKQLARIVTALLVMSGKVTQRNIARWAGKGGSYRSVQRFFQTDIDWLELLWFLFIQFLYVPEHTYLLVGDETVCPKAGKKTFGLDRIYSSIAQKAIPGVSFFGIALVNVQKRQAYTLYAPQVVRTEEEKQAAKQKKQQKQSKKKEGPKKPVGRPKGSKNKDKTQITLSPELIRIQEWTTKVLARMKGKIAPRYFVLDGHYGNHPSYQMVRQLKLHLISKLRSDAELYLQPTAEQKQDHPKLKYGTRLDYEALPEEAQVSSEVKDGYCTQIYQMRCLHKDFADPLNIVVVVRTHVGSQRRGHVVLFSSDLELEALTLVDYYSLRFQIEFEFREAKQHWGLSDFMGVSEASVTNAVGLSFFMGNLSLHLLGSLRADFPEAGVSDLKCWYRGRRYVEETLKCLGELADGIVCERVLERVCRLGLIHSEVDRGERGVSEVKPADSGGETRLNRAA